MSLVQKLAEVMAAVGRIPKRGRNDFHGYDYATEADIVEALRGQLAERKVMLVPEVVGYERIELGAKKNGEAKDPVMLLRMRFTFLDGESAEQITREWCGAGQDGGDKGLYKAMTGGEKYFLLKTFLLPTGDDPEATTRGEKREATARDKATVTAPRAGKKARPPAPEGAVYIEKVVPRTKGNLSWDEVVFSTGVSLVARVPQLGALCAAIAQEGVPVVVETHRNGKGNEELDMVRRWSATPPDDDARIDAEIAAADAAREAVGF